jgi:hypothetical protein
LFMMSSWQILSTNQPLWLLASNPTSSNYHRQFLDALHHPLTSHYIIFMIHDILYCTSLHLLGSTYTQYLELWPMSNAFV